MQEVVSIKNVSNSYGHSSCSFALENISFSVNRSDILGITGPNDTGKSKLFRYMLGLVDDYRGDITIFSKNIKNKESLQNTGYTPHQRLIESFPGQYKKLYQWKLLEEITNPSLSKKT